MDSSFRGHRKHAARGDDRSKAADAIDSFMHAYAMNSVRPQHRHRLTGTTGVLHNSDLSRRKRVHQSVGSCVTTASRRVFGTIYRAGSIRNGRSGNSPEPSNVVASTPAADILTGLPACLKTAFTPQLAHSGSSRQVYGNDACLCKTRDITISRLTSPCERRPGRRCGCLW